MKAKNEPTMTSVPPPEQPSPNPKPVLPPQILAELRTIFPPAPQDEYASVGCCASTKKDITICYNTFGKPSDPCMLLIMGLNSPAPYWDTRFCMYLAAAGFYVIRYDNRDVGLSTHFDEFPTPNILRLALPSWASVGEAPLPYTLEDMAADAVGLLRALKITKAHVVGCSMGGMIAQLIALQYPEFVASLCLHSTSAGVAWPKPKMLVSLLDGPESPRDVESVLDYRVRFYKAMSGDMTFYEHEFRLGMWWDFVRSSYVAGAGRHLAAIARSSDRSALLRARLNPIESPSAASSPSSSSSSADCGGAALRVPVVVLHGGKDPIIPVENGRHLADCIHGSKLVIFPHMGHYFSKDMFKLLADEMMLNARSVVVTE
uniref:Putative hydrolase-like protein n=1 Tax=Angomonas deanei TaxID=59799 RepID=C6K3Q8_9TRYP|nr:putative hydrolase-like protein [Angomonas deanei]